MVYRSDDGNSPLFPNATPLSQILGGGASLGLGVGAEVGANDALMRILRQILGTAQREVFDPLGDLFDSSDRGGGGARFPNGKYMPPGMDGPSRGMSQAVPTNPFAQLLAGAQGQGNSGLESLFNSLLASVNTEAPTIDYESMLQENAEAIRNAYGAEIGAIRRNNKRAKVDARQDRRELERMYESLARAQGKDARRENRETRREVQQMNQLTRGSVRGTEKMYDRLMGQQADLLEGLGQEAAAAETIAPTNRDLIREVMGIRRAGRGENKAIRRQGETTENYLRRAASSSRMEGTNRSADILDDLQEILAANRGQIASLKGAREREITQSNAALEAQAMQGMADAESARWQQLMDLFGMKMGMEQFEADQQSEQLQLLLDQARLAMEQQQAMQSESSVEEGPNLSDFLPENMNNASNILAMQLGPRRAAQGMSIIHSLARTPQMREGRFEAENNEIVRMTPEQAAQMVEQLAREAGWPEPQIQALRMAAYAYAS